MYSKKVINIFKNPKHVGKLNDANGIGEVGNIKCGDMMKVYLKVKNNIIEDVKVETYGCVAAIAASDTMCKLVKGKTLEEAEALTYKKIVEDLGEMPKIKYHCSIMGTEALHKAIKDYRDHHKNEINKGVGKMKYDEKTTLAKALDAIDGPEILAKYHVPCLGCHFASQELNSLTLKDIHDAYGVDLKSILKDLNNSSLEKKKQEIKTPAKKLIAKKVIKKTVSKTKTTKSKKSKK